MVENALAAASNASMKIHIWRIIYYVNSKKKTYKDYDLTKRKKSYIKIILTPPEIQNTNSNLLTQKSKEEKN